MTSGNVCKLCGFNGCSGKWCSDATEQQVNIFTCLTESRNLVRTLNMYQEEAMSTSGDNGRPAESELTKWIMIAALGLAGEAGEVADLYKKQFEQDRTITRDQLMIELGDVLWYVARIASIEGIKLSEVADANIEKLRARYPNGFVPGGGVR